MTALALASAASFGAYFSAPPAFGCDGTNAGGGNCKQAATGPNLSNEKWFILESVIRGLRGFVRL
jgi:hypothetical protein